MTLCIPKLLYIYIYIYILRYIRMESTSQNGINEARKKLRKLFNERRSNLSRKETNEIRKRLHRKEAVYNF